MTGRATLLAVTSAAGILTGRALDGLGALPGVHESDAVRRIALAPSWTVAGLLASVLLGVVVDRLLTRFRSRLLAVGVLVGGQLLVLATPEMLGRTGESSGGGEAPLYVAVAVQLLLSTLTVSTAFLVRRLVPLRPLIGIAAPAEIGAVANSPYQVVLLPHRCGGLGGRAPPRRVPIRPDNFRGDPCTRSVGSGRWPSRPSPQHWQA